MNGLLLDTHVWIWLAEGIDQRLTNAAIQEIDAAAARGALWISVISVWELGLLEAKGRLRLNAPAQEWVRRALDAPGLRLAGLDVETALACNALPGDLHADPADRILIATARLLELSLATRDRQILAYSQAGFVRALAI